eukprot:6813991-Karenia_brevis.AAC.1
MCWDKVSGRHWASDEIIAPALPPNNFGVRNNCGDQKLLVISVRAEFQRPQSSLLGPERPKYEHRCDMVQCAQS